MIKLLNCELGLKLLSPYGDFFYGAVETVNTLTSRTAEHFLVYSNLDAKPLNLRINSACFTSDLFDDSRCDCHWQMVEFMRIMKKEKNGLLIYHLHHEGRANGLITKLKSYKASESGKSGKYAYESIGAKPESRQYNSSMAIIKHLGVTDINLFSNNPEKIAIIENNGVKIHKKVQIKSSDPSLTNFYDWKRAHFNHVV